MKIKSLLALLLALLLSVASLSACAREYPPVESTREEMRVVYTLNIGEESYPVRYELYRAMFLTYKSDIDGGNAALWEGEGAEELVTEMNERILARVTDIYSVIHACEAIGYDLYSREVEDKIREFVKYSVEGGVYMGKTVEGYGDYEKYLAALREMGFNYSVQALIFRYKIGLAALERHYIGDGENEGEFSADEETLREFYFSEDCVRVLYTYIQKDAFYDPEERMEKIRDSVLRAAEGGDDAVAAALIADGGLIDEEKIFAGEIIARNNMEPLYFEDLVTAAFALDEGGVSQAISIHNGEESLYYLLYRAEKTEEHFTSYRDSVAREYLKDKLGELLSAYGEEMRAGVEYSDLYSEIVHSEISME